MCVCSHNVLPSGVQGQNKKGEIKNSVLGYSKDRGAPQEIVCTNSVQGQWKKQKMSTQGCIFESV